MEIGHNIIFFREFIKNPAEVAAVFPSTEGFVEILLEGVPLENCNLVVEFGGGTGAVTRKLMAKIPGDSMCVVVEPNQIFRTILESQGQSVSVITDYAENVADRILSEYGSADLIIAGLPFSLMSSESIRRVGDGTYEMLRQDGQLRFFFYAHSFLTAKVQNLISLIKSQFTQFSCEVSWRTCPPMVLCRAVKY